MREICPAFLTARATKKDKRRSSVEEVQQRPCVGRDLRWGCQFERQFTLGRERVEREAENLADLGEELIQIDLKCLVGILAGCDRSELQLQCKM